MSGKAQSPAPLKTSLLEIIKCVRKDLPPRRHSRPSDAPAQLDASPKAAQPQPHSQVCDFFVSNIYVFRVGVADKETKGNPA